MKIRTIDELQDYVDKEMSWRRKELSAIKSNIFVAKEFAKNTALRSGIAILYAHWEGMIKNIATAYLSFVANQRLQYKELKNNFWSIAVKNDLLGFDETRKSSRHNKIIKNIRNMEDKRAHIPYEDVIKTKSNLNSDVFIEFMLRMIDQVLDEVIIQVNKTNENMSEYVKRMLEVMEYDVPYTANAIMEALHLKSKETFRKNYIKPAIELGLIKMTLPEKPNSKNQRYVKQ